MWGSDLVDRSQAAYQVIAHSLSMDNSQSRCLVHEPTEEGVLSPRVPRSRGLISALSATCGLGAALLRCPVGTWVLRQDGESCLAGAEPAAGIGCADGPRTAAMPSVAFRTPRVVGDADVDADADVVLAQYTSSDFS
jgi:hypothetical protein